MARKKRYNMKDRWDDGLLVLHKRYEQTVILGIHPSDAKVMRFGEYLRSETWYFRKKKLRRQGGYKTCSECRWTPPKLTGAIHIHHAWEKNDKNCYVEETKEWLEPLCYECHNKHHEEEQ